MPLGDSFKGRLNLHNTLTYKRLSSFKHRESIKDGVVDLALLPVTTVVDIVGSIVMGSVILVVGIPVLVGAGIYIAHNVHKMEKQTRQT
ncbi:hypothetical protein C8Q75DRAFT_805726 [Abortiporus biennis]|nr:hypothetical protein C8Q75DRAFT_805726 [Abortiporus biennis]